MNAKALVPSKLNLFDKQFIASRIACLVFIGMLLMYMVGASGASLFIVCSSLVLLFLGQFIFQIPVLNGLLGGTMLLLGVYFSLAVWSEFIEFVEVTKAARQLLIFGWGGCLLVISLAILMIRSAMLQE